MTSSRLRNTVSFEEQILSRQGQLIIAILFPYGIVKYVKFVLSRMHTLRTIPTIYSALYNNSSCSCILIASRLWSIRGQMHDWRHHYKKFPSAVLKWRKVLRIKIIFYVTGQKVRYRKRSCRSIEQVQEDRRRKVKPFLLENDPE